MAATFRGRALNILEMDELDRLWLRCDGPDERQTAVERATVYVDAGECLGDALAHVGCDMDRERDERNHAQRRALEYMKRG